MRRLDPNDRDLLIRTVIGEAGDQPDEGQAGVAHVVLNRLASDQYGKSVRDVVLSPGQFEPWQTRSRELLGYAANSPEYQRAAAIVDQAIAGKISDPTDGATHFLNPDIVRARTGTLPKWAAGEGVKIGEHVFLSPQDASGSPDLLGAWTGAPAKNNAPAVKSRGKSVPAEDLLGAWGDASGRATAGPADSAPMGAPLKITVRPSSSATEATIAPEETLPQATARWAATPGDDWTSRAIRFGAGVTRGVGDVADTLAQGIGYAGEGGANALSRLGIVSPETAASVKDWRAGINRGIAADQAAFTQQAGDSDLASVGRIGGQIAGSAPMLSGAGVGIATLMRGSAATAPIAASLAGRPVISAALKGAGAGSGTAALTSAAVDEPINEQITRAGGLGALLGPAGYGASRLGAKVFGGITDPETSRLAQLARDKFGIPLTVDQLSGNPTVKFLGSVLQRLPFTGYGPERAAQQTAFNSAVAATFGENADKITRPVIKAARTRIGQAFDDAATNTGSIRIDHPFVRDLSRVAADAKSALTASEFAPVENQLRNIVAKIDRNTGTIDAGTYQVLTRKDAPLSRAQQSRDPNIRFYANQVRNALDDVMERSAPPDVAALLRQARYQWAMLKTVEPLAKKAPTGDISPALLMSKVKGGGDIEELGQIGQRFLKEPPSSGTAERGSLMAAGVKLGAGLGGIGGAYLFDPENFQRDLAIIGGTAAVARGGSNILRSKTLANTLINAGVRAPSVAPTSQFPGVFPAYSLPAAGGLIARQPPLPQSP